MNPDCVFCDAALGGNDFTSAWPVGRKVVYDPARGRIWAVCRKCKQWNLAPLDDAERCRAMEELETRWTSTPTRSAGAGVGIAKFPDGRELVRVGEGSWFSFAGWRYGEKLRWRRMWAIWWAIGLTFSPRLDALFGGGDRGFVIYMMVTSLIFVAAWLRLTVAWVRGAAGERIPVRLRHEHHARLVADADSGWSLIVRHEQGESQLRGEEALRVLLPLLARKNGNGADDKTIAEAVTLIEKAGGAATPLSMWLRPEFLGKSKGYVQKLPKETAIVLEMLANEAMERRVLEGEAQVLSIATRQAQDRADIVRAL